MISVCIPTYNGEKFIRRQIDSILQQLGPEDEIIISDDQSTDRTLFIISEVNDSRIKVLKHQPAESQFRFNLTSRNVENALKHAMGKFIFLADQDDIWRSDKVIKTLNLLQQYDLVLHDCEVVNEEEQLISPSYFSLTSARNGIVNNIIKNSYLGCCMAFTRGILDIAIPLPRTEVPHDIWIGLIAEHYGTVKFYNEPLVKYRRHGNNLSFSSEKSTNSIAVKVLYRANIIQALTKKIFFS